MNDRWFKWTLMKVLKEFSRHLYKIRLTGGVTEMRIVNSESDIGSMASHHYWMIATIADALTALFQLIHRCVADFVHNYHVTILLQRKRSIGVQSMAKMTITWSFVWDVIGRLFCNRIMKSLSASPRERRIEVPCGVGDGWVAETGIMACEQSFKCGTV